MRASARNGVRACIRLFVWRNNATRADFRPPDGTSELIRFEVTERERVSEGWWRSRRCRSSPRCNSLKLSRPICSDCHAKARRMRRKNERGGGGGERRAAPRRSLAIVIGIAFADYICETYVFDARSRASISCSVADIPQVLRVNTRRESYFASKCQILLW